MKKLGYVWIVVSFKKKEKSNVVILFLIQMTNKIFTDLLFILFAKSSKFTRIHEIKCFTKIQYMRFVSKLKEF